MSQRILHRLKSLSCCFICLMLVFNIFSLSVSAKSQRKVVRVGYYESSGFQEYDEDTGIYSGYSYEFLMAMQQYTDWEYEFVPCGFSEGLSMLERGEIDLMNNVSMTDEREKIFEFTSLSSGENVAYLAMKSGDTRVAYEDLDAMSEIKIGLAKDSIYSERLVSFFDKNGMTVDIEWFDSRAEVTSAFESGEVDAYVITSSTRTDEHVILSYAPDLYYIASQKGNSDLIDEVDDAITALRENDPYFELHLQEKYYGISTENYTILTASEKAYLQENPVARVIYPADWYPMAYRDKNGEFKGAIRGIYDLIEERTGIRFEYVPIDPENDSDSITEGYQAQIMAVQPLDFSGAAMYDVKLTQAFVSPPLMEVANHMLKPGDTIVLVDGDYLSEVSQKVYGDAYQYIFCDSVEECMDIVKKGGADGTVLISYESEFYRQQHQYNRLMYTIVDDGSYSLAIAVANDTDPRLYAILQKGLNSISKGESSNLFNNTLRSLQKKDMLTMLYDHPLPTFLAAIVIMGLSVATTLSHHFVKKLKQQNDIIYEKNTALQKANQSTTDFFSRMSHDMRTPMNGILGMARLSKVEDDPVVLKQNIAKIEDSGEYLLSLINDTLDFQRIESGRLQLQPEIVNCRDIINSIVQMVKPSMEKKDLNLKLNNKNVVLDCDILVDPVRMKQIFLNLISNAIKFTPEGGEITVEYECMKREEMISHDRFYIRDTGIGMSKDFLENHMFKPFSQEQNEVTGQYAGSGLGLSIVKSLVELMGGTISVESEIGKGTTFIICLDFERVTDDEVKMSEEKKKLVQTSHMEKLQGTEVLLAEDHPLNAEIARKLLERVGCEVTWVLNGQECLDAFCSSAPGQYDVILMDIRMPVMNGLEAAEKIRSLKRKDSEKIPIIAMTANAYEEDVKKSLEAGMNAHLAKPIDPSVLYETINQLVNTAIV